MKKSGLLLAFIVISSLAGFGQSAFATTLFGINFDFQSSSSDAGGAFLQFSVDPQALPFDEWIDLSSVTGFEMDIWATDPTSRDAWVFNETDMSAPNGLVASIYVQNNDPLFPVQIVETNPDSIVTDWLFWAAYPDPNVGGEAIQLWIYQDGTYVVDESNTLGLDATGTWTAGMWFDDPLPVAPVPVPATAWLFGSGLIGLVGVIKRKKA